MLLIDVGGEKNRDSLGTWRTIDIRPGADYILDLNDFKYFPFKDVDAYYSSHTLEHLSPDRVEKVLSECYRTLKPGGKVRIVVPDIKVGIKWYLENPQELIAKGRPFKPEHYPTTPLGYLLSWFYTPDKGNTNGHRMAFDWKTLLYYMDNAGFKDIIKMKYNRCSDIFIEKDIERYRDFSIYAEAVK